MKFKMQREKQGNIFITASYDINGELLYPDYWM